MCAIRSRAFVLSNYFRCSTQSIHLFECTAVFAQSEAERIVDVDLVPGTRKAQHGMPRARGFIKTRSVNPCGIIGPAHFIEFMYCRLEHATLLRVDVFHGVRLCMRKCAI